MERDCEDFHSKNAIPTGKVNIVKFYLLSGSRFLLNRLYSVLYLRVINYFITKEHTSLWYVLLEGRLMEINRLKLLCVFSIL